MEKFYIEHYYWAHPILDDLGNDIRYFNSYEEADDYLNEINQTLNLDDEDNFYIVLEVDGKKVPLEL